MPSLVRLGQSPDADLLYRTLVTFGPRSAADLAGALDMPPHRVGHALDELASAGAVTAGPARPSASTWPARPWPSTWTAGPWASTWTARLWASTWTARPPAEIVAAARRSRSRSTGHGAFTFGEGLRFHPSRVAARARLAELAATARHEQLAMNTERDFDAAAARAARHVDRLLLGRGVRLRVLGPHPIDHPADQPCLAYRAAFTVPMKLVVVDRHTALLPADPDDFERGYLEVSQAPLVAALVELFERHWDAAREPPPGAPPPGLEPRARAVVALLAAGRTDTAAARELGISRRTVTNVLRGLMDRLGVDNRFQLGLVLGARYAVRPPTRATPTAGAPPEDGVTGVFGSCL